MAVTTSCVTTGSLQNSGAETHLELRLSTPITLVLSVLDDFSWGSMAERRFAAATLATPRPVALDMVFDLVIPRALGEVGVRESEPEPAGLEELLPPPPVLGLEGVVVDSRASLLALMVAESTVFCRLKLEAGGWLLLAVRGTAVGGPNHRNQFSAKTENW